jgi:hypothetical protein
MEDLQIVETIVRKDPKVIEQCGILGIPPEDMHKVYCDRKFSPVDGFAIIHIPFLSVFCKVRRFVLEQVARNPHFQLLYAQLVEPK